MSTASQKITEKKDKTVLTIHYSKRLDKFQNKFLIFSFIKFTQFDVVM